MSKKQKETQETIKKKERRKKPKVSDIATKKVELAKKEEDEFEV